MRKLHLLLIAILLGSVGCAYFKAAGPALAPGEINCGETALKEAAIDLLPQVVLALSGTAPDWASDLHVLEAQAGDAVLCAVQVAVNGLMPKAPTPGAAVIAVPAAALSVQSAAPMPPKVPPPSHAVAYNHGIDYLAFSSKHPVAALK